MPLSDADCAATYKILVLGDSSVGKSALLRCLTGQHFKDKLYPTIATDFVRLKVEVDGALVELHIWDTAGQERFRSVTRWQYRGVKGVVMVYDVTDRSTFTHLSYWLDSINSEISHTHNKYEAVPVVLLGNKIDLEGCRQVSNRDGKKLAEKELAFEFLETSAKTGHNVFAAFRKLAYHVTEICNPDIMKSYHRNMIREPKPVPTENCNNRISGTKTNTSKSKQGPMKFNIFKSNKSHVSHVTESSPMAIVTWSESLPQITLYTANGKHKTVKTTKKRFKCCVIS